VNLGHLPTKLDNHPVNHVVLGIIAMVIHPNVINHALQDIIAQREQSTLHNFPVHTGISTTKHME
jgi:hypothetical protein